MEYTKIQLRRDTQANWSRYNPILAEGEVGIVTDLNKFKIGDGFTSFLLLPFATMSLEELEQIKNNADIAMSGMEVVDVICKQDNESYYGTDSNLEVEPNKIYSLVGEDSLFTDDFNLYLKTKEGSTFKGTSYIIFKKSDVPHLSNIYIHYSSNFDELNNFDREKNYHIIQIISNGTFGFINYDFIMSKLKTINGESLESKSSYQTDININGIKYDKINLNYHDFTTPFVLGNSNKENYFSIYENTRNTEVHEKLTLVYTADFSYDNDYNQTIHFFYWKNDSFKVSDIEFQDESGTIFTKKGNVVYDENDPNQVHFAIVLPNKKAVFFLDDMGSGSGSGGGVTMEEVENAITNKNYVPRDSFATINNQSITDGGNIEIQSGVINWTTAQNVTYDGNIEFYNEIIDGKGLIVDCPKESVDTINGNDLRVHFGENKWKNAKVLFRFDSDKFEYAETNSLYCDFYGDSNEYLNSKLYKNTWYLFDLNGRTNDGNGDTIVTIANLSNNPTKLSELENDANYVPKENFATINNQSITDGGNIEIQGGGGTIDTELSTESENAVQNKVITNKINEVDNKIMPDWDYVDGEIDIEGNLDITNHLVKDKRFIYEIATSITDQIPIEKQLTFNTQSGTKYPNCEIRFRVNSTQNRSISVGGSYLEGSLRELETNKNYFIYFNYGTLYATYIGDGNEYKPTIITNSNRVVEIVDAKENQIYNCTALSVRELYLYDYGTSTFKAPLIINFHSGETATTIQSADTYTHYYGDWNKVKTNTDYQLVIVNNTLTLTDLTNMGGVTMEEVDTAITSKGYLTSEEVETSINAKDYANNTRVNEVEGKIPTNNNQLTNGANYTTMVEVEGKGYQTSENVEQTITNKNYATTARVNEVEGKIPTNKEQWVFTMEDGTTQTKEVYVNPIV